MIKRIDPHEADLVVAELRAANPVRRTGTQTPAQVDAFLLEVMERTNMVQDITKRVGSPKQAPTDRRRMPTWVGFAAGFAFATLIAIPLLLVNREPADPALQGLPAAQAELVTELVEAINIEDFDSFRSLFSEDGQGAGFESGLVRPYHEGVEGGQPIPVTDEAGFEADFAWGAALDRRVNPLSCESTSARVFRCEIAFGLGAWRAEWVETMAVALSEDGRISLLATEPLDLDPINREQPMSLTGYFEFQDWLVETHPDEYRRLINPGTPGSINGVEILFGADPRNPDLIDDLTALIDEYLAGR